ncbi:glycosyltransferase family 4 protein [Candidatus Bathyarchaeota archaeon]|nr:glycosyltransferase family 4 protein [Candidatus Bathyarchaeota archaeon]
MSCFKDLMLKDMGPSVRIYNLAKGLVSLGHKVHIIIPNDRVTHEHIDGLIVHGIKGFFPKVILKIFGKLLGVSRPTSLLFYDFLFISRAIRIIRESNVVQIEQQSAGGLLIPIVARILKKPLVIDCHDTFQALRIKHTTMLRKILETFLEKIAYEHANVILTVSEKEKEYLASYGIGRRNIEVIPNGVDTKAFNPSSDITNVQNKYDLRNFHTVTFVGNMEYLPNQEAVQVIASEIAPKVQKEINNTKFLIVGRNHVKVESSNLTFTGVVENVAELLNASDIAIAPLFHGSGTRLKILEYFSCGLPVVSTTVGVEGLDVKSQVNVLIEDDMNEFTVKVIELLKDRILSMRLGEAARKLVLNKYDWEKIVRQLNIVYHNLLFGTNNRIVRTQRSKGLVNPE